ncbi:hypothetical protein [Solimonas soli]|uniref:hypothetical protein n=1 Tax=Solimonas soli TaxID=413479 RepID=UPI000482B52B|nr:hypothetical protein [Solimonas soli]
MTRDDGILIFLQSTVASDVVQHVLQNADSYLVQAVLRCTGIALNSERKNAREQSAVSQRSEAYQTEQPVVIGYRVLRIAQKR